jgi:hypothetical protein
LNFVTLLVRMRNVLMHRIGFILILLAVSITQSVGQRSSFLEQMRVGFGAGVNFSHILETQSYNLYEDLEGEVYESKYRPFYQNFGHQYFIHLDYQQNFLSLSLKPGTYTFNFSRESSIPFQNETVTQENSYTLRYFEIPLEAKYTLDLNGVQPYVGGAVAYAHMLGSSSNSTIIKPKITLGALAGAYIDLQYIILDVNIGYNYGLHVITSKSNRTDTGNPDAFTQSDIRLNDIRINVSALFALQKRRSTGRAACNYPVR